MHGVRRISNTNYYLVESVMGNINVCYSLEDGAYLGVTDLSAGRTIENVLSNDKYIIAFVKENKIITEWCVIEMSQSKIVSMPWYVETYSQKQDFDKKISTNNIQLNNMIETKW